MGHRALLPPVRSESECLLLLSHISEGRRQEEDFLTLSGSYPDWLGRRDQTNLVSSLSSS